MFLGNLGTDSVRHQTHLDCHLRIPAGWWWTAISTQPSVTLHHTYWSFENRHCENHWDPPFFTSRKKKHTPSSWIHLVDLGLWWEFCRWDCSRWVYSPSICPPYISNSGNPPFFGSIQRLGFVEALWAPFESQQTSVDAPCPTKRGEGDGSRRGERCCVTACAQQVDVISVMSLGTEWQDGIVYSDDVLWSLVLFALSPSPDMCFQDPTVIVHWHFPSVVGHGMIDTSSPWHLDGASIIAVNSPTIQSRVSGCFWFPS